MAGVLAIVELIDNRTTSIDPLPLLAANKVRLQAASNAQNISIVSVCYYDRVLKVQTFLKQSIWPFGLPHFPKIGVSVPGSSESGYIPRKFT